MNDDRSKAKDVVGILVGGEKKNGYFLQRSRHKKHQTVT